MMMMMFFFRAQLDFISQTLFFSDFYILQQDRSYRQYLEFALKLGYSEKLIQIALSRLGNPTNNELLAELIKLGAQPGSNGKSHKYTHDDDDNIQPSLFFQLC